jgi:hypothetical protein
MFPCDDLTIFDVSQVKLAQQFHCVLTAQLLHTYPNSSDCVSVWKRTNFIVRAGEAGSNEGSSSESEHSNDDHGSDSEGDMNDSEDSDEYTDCSEEDGMDEDSDDNEEEEEDDHAVVEKSKPLPKLAAADCEFISIADLAKLRGEEPKSAAKKSQEAPQKLVPKNNSVPASSACEYMSIADLNKLREQQMGTSVAVAENVKGPSGANKKKSKKSSKVLSILREMLLDNQYDETGDTMWASIPADERLPIDCAIPSLRHLLAIDE